MVCVLYQDCPSTVGVGVPVHARGAVLCGEGRELRIELVGY